MNSPLDTWPARRGASVPIVGLSPHDPHRRVARRSQTADQFTAGSLHRQSHDDLQTREELPTYDQVDRTTGDMNPPRYNEDELIDAAIDYTWLYGSASVVASAGRLGRRIGTSILMAGVEPAIPARPKDGLLHLKLTRTEYLHYARRGEHGEFAGLAREVQARAWLRWKLRKC